jgi:hypothetical protein
MGKHDMEIEVLKARSHDVFCKVFPAGNGDADVGFFVHYYHVGNVRKPVVFRHLVMRGSISAPATVGGVALDDCAVHPLD